MLMAMFNSYGIFSNAVSRLNELKNHRALRSDATIPLAQSNPQNRQSWTHEGNLIKLPSWKQFPIFPVVTIVYNSPRISLVKLKCALLDKTISLYTLFLKFQARFLKSLQLDLFKVCCISCIAMFLTNHYLTSRKYKLQKSLRMSILSIFSQCCGFPMKGR